MFIYILVCKGFCKIGHTNNLSARIGDLQTGCPFRLQLYFSILVPKQLQARHIECWSHFELRDCWSGIGEWFACRPRRAKGIIEKVMDRNDTRKPSWYVRSEDCSKAAKAAWTDERRNDMSIRSKKLWRLPAYQAKLKGVLANNRTKIGIGSGTKISSRKGIK